jgi:hypothetical protein
MSGGRIRNIPLRNSRGRSGRHASPAHGHVLMDICSWILAHGPLLMDTPESRRGPEPLQQARGRGIYRLPLGGFAAAPPLPWFAKGEAGTASFGFSFFGFFASRLPRCSPLAMACFRCWLVSEKDSLSRGSHCRADDRSRQVLGRPAYGGMIGDGAAAPVQGEGPKAHATVPAVF